MSLHHVLAGVTAVGLFTGCGLIDLDFGELTETDTITDETRLPEEDAALVSTVVDDDRVTFTYSSAPDAKKFEPGQIIVGKTDGGYLREVQSVEVSGNSLVVWTKQAALTDAIANIQIAQTIDPEKTQNAIGLLDLSGHVLVDTTIQNVPVKIVVKRGLLSLSPSVDLELDITKQKVEHVAVTAKGTLTLTLELEVSVGGSLTFAQDFDLSGPTAVLYQYPFTFFVPTLIGPLPVAGTIEIDAFAGFSAGVTAQGSLTSGLEGSTSFALTAAYDNGAWSVDGTPSFDGITLRPPQVTTLVASEARAYIRPELRVRLYKVVGPRASITPSLKAAITAVPTPSVKLDGCVTGQIGFDVTLFGKQLLDLAHDFPEVCRALE